MFNLKLITSKSVLLALLTALVAQTSVQAFSIATYADAIKNAAQASVDFAQSTASSAANSSLVVTTREYVKTKAGNVVATLKKDPTLTAMLISYGCVAAILLLIEAGCEYDKYSRNKQSIAQCAAEVARIAQAQAHIDALCFDDFLKLVNAHVIEAQQLFNEVGGPRILELNNARYNYELSEEEMNAIVQELTFVCAAQSNNSYSLVQAEELLEKALAIMTRRTEQRGATDLGMCDRTAKFIQEIKEVRSLINEFAALYQDQVSSDFNQKVTEYRTQNPVEQVTLIAHNCGNNCLKALSCECSGCACTAQTALQS